MISKDEEFKFYYVKVVPHENADGKTGTYMKAIQMESALNNIGVNASLQYEKRVYTE